MNPYLFGAIALLVVGVTFQTMRLNASQTALQGATAALASERALTAAATQRESEKVVEAATLRRKLSSVRAAQADACSEAPALPAIVEGLR